MPAMANDTEPLLSAYHFNYTQRPRRDKAWALAYYLLLLLTLGWALINLILRPDLVAVLSSADYLDDPNNCPPSLTLPATYGPNTSRTSAAASTASASASAATTAAAAAADATAGRSTTAGSPGASSGEPHLRLLRPKQSRAAAWLTRKVAAAHEVVAPAARRAAYHRSPLPDTGVHTPVWTPYSREGPGAAAATGATGGGKGRDTVGAERTPAGIGTGFGTAEPDVDWGAAETAQVGGAREEEEEEEQQEQGSWLSSAAAWRRRQLVLDSDAASVAHGGDGRGRDEAADDGGSGSDRDGDGDGPVPRVLLDYGGLLLLMSLGAALVLASVFVLALRYSPWALVLLSCGLQVAAPLASAVVASTAGNSTLALLLLLASCAIAVSLYCGRKSLALVSRLLGVGAVALRDNTALLGLVAALKVALAGATALLMAAIAVVGAAGEVVPNPLREGSPRCVNPHGQLVTCCALAPAPALAAYLPAAGITLAWTLLLLFEVKVYVVSGVVAQWYFSPAGHLAGPGYNTLTAAGAGAFGAEAAAADGGAASIAGHDDGAGGGGGRGRGGEDGCLAGGYSSSRALLASLGQAMGPSFGSLCAASGVLGATSYVRAVVNSITSRARDAPSGAARCACAAYCCCCCSCLAAVLGGCCWCVVGLLEQLSKYATVQMSMSGLGFWRASCEVVVLLRRNFMDAYNMWWYLPMVLHCGAAAFAAAWGYAAYWLARQCWAPFTHSSPLSAASAAVLGTLAAATAELVLSFVCSVLVNIADALFICFVLDRDSGAVTWYDMHCVFATLPCCAAARAAAEGQHHHHHNHYGGGGYGAGGAACAIQPPYYYMPPPTYGGSVSYVPYGYQVAPAPQPLPGGGAVGGAPHRQLGHVVGYGAPQQRPQYGSGYGGGGGFWGWLRSPSGSGSGAYGMPVGGSRYRNDRPQYPPPAVLSPPYSDQQFPVRPPRGPPPSAPFYGSPARQS